MAPFLLASRQEKIDKRHSFVCLHVERSGWLKDGLGLTSHGLEENQWLHKIFEKQSKVKFFLRFNEEPRMKNEELLFAQSTHRRHTPGDCCSCPLRRLPHTAGKKGCQGCGKKAQQFLDYYRVCALCRCCYVFYCSAQDLNHLSH